MMEKERFFIALIVVFFLLIIIVPKNVCEINNANVNKDNGDVAFCYLDYSGKIPMLCISLFDKNGEELFTKALYSKGGSHADICFYEGFLCVYVSRTDESYFFDRSGEKVEAKLRPEDFDDCRTFDGWSGIVIEKRYFLNGYEYRYEMPTIFRHKAILKIITEERTVTIYDSL